MDNQNRKTCAFTGHRLHKLPGCEVDGSLKRLELIDRIEVVILTLIERMGVCHFITGMALGVDTYAAQSVLRIKNKHPHITLEAAIPCRDQEKKWSDKQKQIYYSILDRCDKITLVQEK